MSRSNAILFFLRICTIAASLIVLRLASASMYAGDYDRWVLARQLLGFLANVTVGALIATALPRAVMVHRLNFPPSRILVSAAVVTLPVALFAGAAAFFSDAFAAWLSITAFGGDDAATVQIARLVLYLLVPWSTLLLLSFYLRGLARFTAGIALEFCFGGLLPLVLILALPRPILAERFLYFYLILLCLLAAGVLAGVFLGSRQAAGRKFAPELIIGREVLKYGVPKLFSNIFLLCAYGLLPTFILRSGGNVSEAAAVSLTVAIAGPICSVLLLQLSSSGFRALIERREQPEELRALVSEILRLAVFLGAAGIALGWTAMELLVGIVSTDVYHDNSRLIQVSGAALLLYLPIMVLEVPLDGLRPAWAKARIGCVLVFALCIFIIAAPALRPIPVIAVPATVAALLFIYACTLARSLMQLVGVQNILAKSDPALLILGVGSILGVSSLLALLKVEHAGIRFVLVAALGCLQLWILARANLLSLLLGGAQPGPLVGPRGERSKVLEQFHIGPGKETRLL